MVGLCAGAGLQTSLFRLIDRGLPSEIIH